MKTAQPTSRAALALAIGGGSALVLALAVAAIMARGAIAGRADTRAVDAAPPVLVTAEPIPSASVAPSMSVAAVVASAVPSAAPSSGTKPATGRPGIGGRPPPPPRNKCEIPFVIDAKGQKHFKPECVE